MARVTQKTKSRGLPQTFLRELLIWGFKIISGAGDGSVVEYLPMLRQFHKKRVGYKDKVNVKRLAHLHLLS